MHSTRLSYLHNVYLHNSPIFATVQLSQPAYFPPIRLEEHLACNLTLLCCCSVQADDTIQMIIYDNEYQQGASRGTVNAMAADNTQNWTLTFLNGDVSYARLVMPAGHASSVSYTDTA